MPNIYRYTIESNRSIGLPQGYEILKVDWSIMHNEACLWAIVNPDNPAVTVHLETIPTGGEVPSWVHTYLGSFQEPSGLVFHVFKY
jgi:hypothetical protein